jgi:hypothetical protein
MTGLRLYVTPASPWVRRVVVSILELGIGDRFEFVQTRGRTAGQHAASLILPTSRPRRRSSASRPWSRATCTSSIPTRSATTSTASSAAFACWRATAQRAGEHSPTSRSPTPSSRRTLRAAPSCCEPTASARRISSTRCVSARCAVIVRSTSGRRISLRPSTSPRSPSPSPAATTTGATPRTAGETQRRSWRTGSTASLSGLRCARPSPPRLRRRSTPAQALTWRSTNSTMCGNMSPLLDRSGDWPAARSISRYSSVIEPPALRYAAQKRCGSLPSKLDSTSL